MTTGEDVGVQDAPTAASGAARRDEGPQAGERTGSPFRRGAAGVGLFLAAEAVFLLVLRIWQPRFFYIDDKMAQYLPVWHWLGQRAGWSGVPLMDPDQGSAGAFTADLQYGVLDPFHWVLAAVIGRLDGLNAAAWGLHLLAVVVLGAGIVAVGTRLGLRPGWSALAAVGAANSGFLLWYGASWWPSAWGTALLPWLWWALISRSRWAVPGAVLAAYLLGTSGYPYTLPFAALIVVGVLLEHALRTGDWRLWRAAGLRWRTAGAAAGLLLAAPGLLAAGAMAPYSSRAVAPADLRGNAATFIPNLADVLLGGATTSVEVTGWWGNLLPPAVMATGWFVLPLLALVRWDRLRGRSLSDVPGLVTGLLLAGAAVVATQTPTDVGSFRFPFRYVVVLEIVAPLVVAVLVGAVGLVLTGRRLLVAAGLLLVQGALGLFRAPLLVEWHLGVALAGVALLALAFRLNRSRAGLGPAALAVLLVATVAAPLASVGTAMGFERLLAADQERAPSGLPAAGLYNVGVWPASVSGFREASLEPGLNATVVVWGGAGYDRGLNSGVPVGSAALFSGVRPGFGYTSLGQRGWAERWCQDYLGQSATCPDAVARLLEPVPGTDLTWLDLTSKDVLLLGQGTPPELVSGLEDEWVRVGRQGTYERYERRTPTEGRVTFTGDGVTAVTAEEVGTDSETYRVTWTAGADNRVITRIPSWPGYRATLDGRPLPVRPLEGTVVAVELPAEGGSGELRIFFEPPRRGLGLAAAGLGVLVAVVATAADLWRRRRPA